MSTKYTTLFEYKLPSFIKDDPAYSRFIDFFKAYYEWFDETYDIYGFGDKLDIDYGFKEFYAYFAADFLPYFPDVDTIAADKIKLLKIVKELYKSKGIPDSFKFLFRALYNKNVEIYETNQYVLKPSDGKWIVPKSIKIKSLHPDFLNIDNFKVFGETSKSIGVIEKSKINGKFIQIYLSNIERVFTSGENIRILDYDNKDVYFLNGEYLKYDDKNKIPTGAVLLSSKIIGSLSSIDINKNRRGKYYKVNDPVVITGGFSLDNISPIGASGYISEVTTGQILNVVVTNGGYGYTLFPNTVIDIVKSDGTVDSVANCIVSLVDTSSPADVGFICDSCIEDNLFTVLGNTTFNFSTPANANTPLNNFLSFTGFSTYPVTAVSVRNGGGGYEEQPVLNFNSTFTANTISKYPQRLEDLGILAPIEIVQSGIGYAANDTISIIGGDGNFAYARINSVNSAGSITSVEYYQDSNNPYSLGGMGYNNSNLPLVQITSQHGANAELTIPSILATGLEYTIETDKIGAITKISLLENGEDYIYTPNVSLRIQDIVITGTNIESIDPDKTIVYQGNLISPTFTSNINSVTSLYFDSETNYQIFSIRIYDYKGNINTNLPLTVYNTETKEDVSILDIKTNYTTSKYKNGIKVFGDGSAIATAKFLNGLIEDEGRYLNSDGQLSAHSVLQNDIYNSSTYILATEKDYDSYKTTINNLLHPIGTHLITRNLLKSNTSFNVYANTVLNSGNNLISVNSSILIQNSNSVFSNSIYIGTSANINSILSVNNNIYITGDTNLNLYSTIKTINSNNIIELSDYVQYKYPNVYNGYTSSNTVIITNENYNDAKYALSAFVFIGDSIILANNNINTIINITGNVLYFANSLNQSGNTSITANVTLIKSLTSNNITIYRSV